MLFFGGLAVPRLVSVLKNSISKYPNRFSRTKVGLLQGQQTGFRNRLSKNNNTKLIYICQAFFKY